MRARALLIVTLTVTLSGAHPAAAQSFTEMGVASGVSHLWRYSTGGAWADHDGDGDLDLYVTHWGTATGTNTANALYRNDDSSFVDVADVLGVANDRNSVGAAWADYDGDGDLDLYVADFFEQDFLYASQGVGAAFTEVGRAGEMVNLVKLGSSTSAAWGDYDGDGLLDLYLGKFYYDNELYHNEGDGQLSPVTDLDVGDRRDTNAFTWVDYDNDGDLDIYAVNREQENALFRNGLSDGDGFTDVAHKVGLASMEIGQSAAWGDFDGDGDLDLYVGNTGANALYRNDGGDTFVDVATGVARSPGSSWIAASVTCADYDGDGRLDLFIGTGDDTFTPVYVPQHQADVLLRNVGGDEFEDATVDGKLSRSASVNLNSAWGDFNGDGAPDLFASNAWSYTEGIDPWAYANRLYRNDTPDSLFIRVAVRGSGAPAGGNNLQGLGARIWLIDNATQDTVAFQQVLPGVAAPRYVDGELASELIFGAPAGPYDIEVRFPNNPIRRLESVVSGGDQVIVVEP